VIPAPPAAKAAVAPIDLKAVLAAFHGEITPVRTTLTYRIAAVFVTVVMLILPVIYLAMIAGVGYLVYYHAIYHAEMIPKLRNVWAMLFAYAGPIVAGVILLFFMVKPLFAPRSRYEPLVTVELGQEPLLYSLVTRIARAVGAPEPKRIDLDANMNASASFGSFLGGDLVLTIGMPLAAGMTINEFAGVIAHELGHFSQGVGMRLSYVIRTINHWFARVVYERDDWDESLVRACDNGDRLTLILYLARLCVWITRGVLWLLMAFGHAISCFLMRQMEYDADRYETRLVGSDVFVATSRRLLSLDVGAGGAQILMIQSWLQARRLPDDLSELMTKLAAGPESKVRELEQETAMRKTGTFDSHPCHADRVRAAKRENAAGVFHLAGPATALFSNFAKMSGRVSFKFYRQIFGKEVERGNLIPTSTLLE
jgi:Zn-dependent protease with chaperone function